MAKLNVRMTIARRSFLVTMGLLLTAPAFADSFPSRPITIVTGYAAGAASDMLARTLAEGFQAEWGQPVIVDNRAGSSGNIAAGQVARANPDGYTIMVATDATLTSNMFLYKSMPFDPVKSFAPVSNIAANIMVLAVHPDMPARSVAEFIAHAKQNPGKISFGSSGAGSPHHLVGVLLNQSADIELAHVPYKGGGQAINDLVGGHIPSAILSLSAAKPLHDSGKIRILGVIEKDRYPTLPNVPTIAETVKGFDLPSWIGLVAPANTPADVIEKLNAASLRILGSPKVKDKLASYGLVVMAGSPAEFTEAIKAGLEARGRLIKASGIQPE